MKDFNVLFFLIIMSNFESPSKVPISQEIKNLSLFNFTAPVLEESPPILVCGDGTKLAFGLTFPNIFYKYYLGKNLSEISSCVWP